MTVVPTIAAAKRALATAAYDVALVDYDLDDGKGDELVRWLHAEGLRVPAIGVSARAERNDALLAAGVRAVCPNEAGDALPFFNPPDRNLSRT